MAIISWGLILVLEEKAAVKMIVWKGDHWTAYDDEETLKIEANYAADKGLGGLMVRGAS